jgi:hypothetical protein
MGETWTLATAKKKGENGRVGNGRYFALSRNG